MDRSGVQRVFPTGDAQKARTLLIRLFAELRYLEKLRTRSKAAVFFPVCHNIFGNSGIDAGNMPQQRRGRGIQVNAHRVYAAFYHTGKRCVQTSGRHIMLILPDSDGFWVDFNQLRQRILQTAGNGDRTAQVHIIIRELLACQLGSGIDRCTRLADDGILNRQTAFRNQLRHDFLRFTTGGTVADGNNGDMVLFQEVGHTAFGFRNLIKGLGRINHGGIQHTPCGVYHRQLAAIAVTGIPAQHHLTGERGLHQ